MLKFWMPFEVTFKTSNPVSEIIKKLMAKF